MAVDEAAATEPVLPARRRFTVLRLMGIVAIAAACFAYLDETVAVGLTIGAVIVSIWPLTTRWQTIELVATVIWLLVAIVAFSDVTVNVFTLLLLEGSGFVLALSWIARAVVALGRAGPGRPKLPPWPDRLAWAFVPAAGMLGVALLFTDADFELRLRLSEPALRACVREAQAGGPAARYPRRVGLFWVHQVEDREGVMLLSTGAFLFDDGGLAELPGPSPPTWPDFEFWYVRGRWWRNRHKLD